MITSPLETVTMVKIEGSTMVETVELKNVTMTDQVEKQWWEHNITIGNNGNNGGSPILEMVELELVTIMVHLEEQRGEHNSTGGNSLNYKIGRRNVMEMSN